MVTTRSAVIIGASTGLGRSLAYQLAKIGTDVILSSRNEMALETISMDLQKFSIKTKVICIDLEKIDYQGSLDYVEKCFKCFERVSCVYITAAVIDDKDEGNRASLVLEKISNINYRGVSLLISAFCEKLNGINSKISVVSSIAAIRPRGKNIAYSSSKIALEYHVRGLQHYYQSSPMKLQLFRVGYMDTPMTQGKKLIFKKQSSMQVAKLLIKSSTTTLVYYPRFWYFISLALRMMPWPLFKRLKF